MSIRIKKNTIGHPTSNGLQSKQCNGCEHLYYNITIPHNKDEKFTEAVYRKNNTEPILSNPEDYNVSIARFSIGTNQVPIFVAEPVIDGLDELVYKVSLTYDTHVSTINIINTQSSFDGSSLVKYFYYSYSRFLKEVNTAINSAFINLDAMVPGGLPALSEPPYMTFNQSQNVFSIVAQTSNYADNLPDNQRIDIWFNYELEPLLAGGFDTDYYFNGRGGNIDLISKFKFYDKFNNIDSGYFIDVQDYSILSFWNSFRSLQITSNLPIQQEFIENDFANSNSTTSQNILKDFIVLYTGDEVARTTVDYTINDYEYIDLKGVEPIRNIDINIFWVDKKGKQYPLFLGVGESCQIKLLFKKKDITY